MPPINPKSIAAKKLNPFEGDPFSRSKREQGESTFRSQEDIDAQNAKVNSLYGSMKGRSSAEVLHIGDFDSGVAPETIDRLNGEGADDNPGKLLVSPGGVEDFQSKLGQESRHIGFEVAARLQGYGMPETAISGDLSRVVNQRLFAKVEEIQNSYSERLETDNIGGGVLPQEARLEVIRAVAAEELVRYYESDKEAVVENLSVDGIKEIHNHLAGDGYETRNNEDASRLGVSMDKLSTNAASVKELAEEGALELVEDGVSPADAARKSLDDVYDGTGIDVEVSVNTETINVDSGARGSEASVDPDEVSLDPSMTKGGESAKDQTDAIRKMIDEQMAA